MMRSSRTTALLAVLVAGTAVQACGGPAADQADGVALSAAGGPIRYVPMPASFRFLPADTINAWINARPINRAAISRHLWTIWDAMNTPAGQSVNGTSLPVWETWWDGTEIFLDSPDTAAAVGARLGGARRLEQPRQFGHRPGQGVAAAGQPVGSVLSFNRFTQEMKDHVLDSANAYYDVRRLAALNASFGPRVPLPNRRVVDFPNTSIMLKPVFWIVDGAAPSMVPYWAGISPATTVDARNPSPTTWRQCVLVDPTGRGRNDRPRVCNPQTDTTRRYGNTTLAAGTYQVVPINADPAQSGFYAFQLTTAEVAQLGRFNFILGNSDSSARAVRAGDYALLVATHVSTREIDNWTWQTFWWGPPGSPVPGEPEGAESAPSGTRAPWNRYMACQAYYMVDPPGGPGGRPLRCFNPYLETDLTGLFNVARTDSGYTGVQSNCMSCHRAAAWMPGPAGQPYARAEYLAPGDRRWFTGNLKTDFLWSIPVRSHGPPFRGP